MPNPITLGFSPFSGKIYAGRSKPVKDATPGVRQFTGDKVDVTNDALGCVADKILKDGKPVKWILDDGRIMTLSVEITVPE
ncbi:hypothetical protein [Pantoea stewartii]|uniref:DUF7446 family protein n=1 Tax=Pantoea stewartii TaxID=66269 RepID=UPI00197D8C9A|nr:hypothetical protein [Pantoea stewartii]